MANLGEGQVPDEPRSLASLVAALRVLEEHRGAGRLLPSRIVRFLAELDLRLSDEERWYVGMAFAARKEMRDELTRSLVDRMGISRGAVIAGIRAHLQGLLAQEERARRASRQVETLRASVLVKVAQVLTLQSSAIIVRIAPIAMPIAARRP